ncbi:hypothetical protein XH99_34405 [Bradyrhizobium nanningense]|uniref:Uncharacterized protein n=1 Tax=Bradyrhizobium nanningense TaxID=1325118 RepID=A0A4Q0RTN9_9BRAD|nr:hypothetical protein [Bradyrhizobium nanningense]RXH22095.1 hypothetical protein XH99_34405 [Bradyrhizobium nanningense]RXH28283.1 hypothetical protein XH84_25045 [Bradyrhizobium nanningense]
MKNRPLDQAIRAQALRREIKLAAQRQPADEVRTTYSIAPDARRALRMLAASLDCAANDLICIALENLLMAHGSQPVSLTRTDLRDQLSRLARSQPQEPNSGT